MKRREDRRMLRAEIVPPDIAARCSRQLEGVPRLTLRLGEFTSEAQQGGQKAGHRGWGSVDRGQPQTSMQFGPTASIENRLVRVSRAK